MERHNPRRRVVDVVTFTVIVFSGDVRSIAGRHFDLVQVRIGLVIGRGLEHQIAADDVEQPRIGPASDRERRRIGADVSASVEVRAAARVDFPRRQDCRRRDRRSVVVEIGDADGEVLIESVAASVGDPHRDVVRGRRLVVEHARHDEVRTIDREKVAGVVRQRECKGLGRPASVADKAPTSRTEPAVLNNRSLRERKSVGAWFSWPTSIIASGVEGAPSSLPALSRAIEENA